MCVVLVVGIVRWTTRCFFFQAEDGIRDDLVTGVQTCALPIFQERLRDLADDGVVAGLRADLRDARSHEAEADDADSLDRHTRAPSPVSRGIVRERRVRPMARVNQVPKPSHPFAPPPAPSPFPS